VLASRRSLRALVVCLALGSTLVPPATCFAEPPAGAAASEAERLYEQGTELMRAGELVAACKLLAESQLLDPAPGGALALGVCQERRGLYASAVRAYTDAARLAHAAGDGERAAAADARIDALRARVPKVEVTIGEALRDGTPLELVLDGVVAPTSVSSSIRIDVDPGRHAVEVRSATRASSRVVFEARVGEVTALVLDVPPRAPAVDAAVDAPSDASIPARSEVEAPAPAARPGMSPTRWVGLISLGSGVAALGAGGIVALVGASSDAKLDELGYDASTGSCRTDLVGCRDAFESASSAADASTALWIGGGALVGVGLTLFVLGGGEGDGSTAVQVGPTGARVEGAF